MARIQSTPIKGFSAKRVASERKRFPLDWMATFLEDHVRPKLSALHHAFQLEYLEIYDEWASDPIHEGEAYDTEKCLRLMSIAEGRLPASASAYFKRFLFHALRTLPLPVAGEMIGAVDWKYLVRSLTIASHAVAQFAKDTPPDRLHRGEGQTALLVTEDEFVYAQQNLATDLAKMLSAANMRLQGELFYRATGKGGRLTRPQRVPRAVWARLNACSDAHIVLPTPTLQPDARLQKAISEYDERRSRHGLGISGFLLESDGKPRDSSTGWWKLRFPMDWTMGNPVQIEFPRLDITISTNSYFPTPSEAADYINWLEPFAPEFPRCFGLDFGAFQILCASVYKHILRQTGFHMLSPVSDRKVPVFTCPLESGDPRARTTPGFLYDLFARAALRGLRESYVRVFTADLKEARHPAPGQSARQFINVFRRPPVFDDFLTPSLFYDIDHEFVMLDLLLMQEFFERCLRAITSGSGTSSQSRGPLFEESARKVISSELKLNKQELPVKPNRRLKDVGRDYGDVDFAFVWQNVLINLDMKSWQKTPEYFRGDFKAVDNRQKALFEALASKVTPRGRKLQELLARERPELHLCGTVTFLCVADVEYISPQYPDLWYGDIPRVLTAPEIVELLSDQVRFGDLLKAAQISEAT